MKKKNSNSNKKVKITRFDPKADVGLSIEQINQRVEENLVNVSNIKTSKTIKSILIYIFGIHWLFYLNLVK